MAPTLPTVDQHWIEPKELPGYAVSRDAIKLSEEGAKHGALEPHLGRTENGDLAYWVKPIGFSFSLRLRIEGLRGFFRGPHQESDHGRHGAQGPCVV